MLHRVEKVGVPLLTRTVAPEEKVNALRFIITEFILPISRTIVLFSWGWEAGFRVGGVIGYNYRRTPS